MDDKLAASLRKTRRVMIASGLLLGAGVAHAQATIPSTPTAALHAGKRALDTIGQIALSQVPPHIVLPPVDADIISCPIGDPISIHVSQAYVDVVPNALTFAPAEGSLGINANLDISGFAHVDITKGYGCIGDASCDVSFSATSMAPTAQLNISVQGGQPTTSVGNVGVTVPDGNLHVSFANCILDGLSSGVVDDVSQELLVLAQGPIGDQIRAQVPPLLDAQLATMLTQTGSVDGYSFAATLTDLNMTAAGIDAYAQVGVGYSGPVAACLPAGMTEARSSTPLTPQMTLPPAMGASVVVGVAPGLVSDAISAAWQSGILCADDSALAGLGFDPSTLASLVPGLPAGFGMHFSMGLDSAPTVDTAADGSINMHVKGAEMLIALTADGQQPAGIAVETDFSVGVIPTVDAASGTVFATLSNMTMEHLEVHSGSSGATIDVDPERLSVLMSDVVLPMASAKLKGMPLSPASFGAMGVYTWLSDLAANPSGIYVGAEIYRPDPSVVDTGLPDTQLVKSPAALVRPGMVRFSVTGSDDITPYQLLRYEVQIDDGPIAAPVFGGTLSSTITAPGTHVFKVRAVDLAGNRAPSFIQSSFDLDAVPPTLDVTNKPSVSLRSTTATIQFTGSDDRSAPTALSYAYRVETRPPGGDLTLVSVVPPATMAGGTGEIDIGNLVDGNTYQVTLQLYDEAGNVTSQQIGFGVAGTNGCSMSARSNASFGSLLLVACALLLAARRRRAV